MSRSSEPATCPSGHPEAGRVVSLVAAPVREGDEALGGAASSSACTSCAAGSCASCGR